MENQESFVRQALADFLRKHSAEDSISSIDEIVLSYMVGILEELGSPYAGEDAFDVDDFTEMMDAYLPHFAEISSVAICEWMFELAGQLGQTQGEQHSVNGGSTLSFTPPTDCLLNYHKTSLDPPLQTETTIKKRTKRNSSSSSDKEVSFINTEPSSSKEPAERAVLDEDDPGVQLLLEMFPSSCTLELSHCLCLAGRDVEQAARLVLLRQESGDSIRPTTQFQNLKTPINSVPNDQKLRDSLISKYSYIDTEEDKKEHKPHMPKAEPKKLVRYLDNKVVSTKGERFTEMKKLEDEEVKKKSSANSKGGNKNRSH